MKLLAEKQDNKASVKVLLDKNETIDKFNYGIVSTGAYNTLSRVSQIQFDDDKILVYHISSEKNINEWLLEKHNEFDFTSLLSSISKTFIDVTEEGLNIESILLDSEYIFVNDKKKSVEFLYIPLNGYKSGKTPYEFMYSIIKNIEFLPGEKPKFFFDIENFVSKRDFSFKLFKEMIDEKCGKSIREEYDVVFDSGDEDAKKKIKKSDDIFLKGIPSGSNGTPLQKKNKFEPGKINPDAKKKIHQDESVYRPVESGYPQEVKISKKLEEHRVQDNVPDIYTPGGFVIPNIAATTSSKNKLSKKAAKKASKADRAVPNTSAMDGLDIPEYTQQQKNKIPEDISNCNLMAPKQIDEKNASKRHGFNLTELLIDFVKNQKEKNKQKPDNIKKKKQKKQINKSSDYAVPDNSKYDENTDSGQHINDDKGIYKNHDLPLDDINNSNEALKKEDEIRFAEERRIEAERAKLERERAELRANIIKNEEARRLEAEKQKIAREKAEREAEEKRKAEERLSAERNMIAKEKEKQQQEALRISEEKKKIEAERARLEKEIAENMQAEQRKLEKEKIIEDKRLKVNKEKKQEDLSDTKEDNYNEAHFKNNKVDKSGSDNPSIVEDESSAPTVFLTNNNYVAYLYPKLLRKKTNETVYISKSAYRIGKEKSNVDYCISNNSAISRLHAIIYCKEGRYYIVDTLSTNHTFVNGKIITSNQNYELLNGDIITLANEDFEFTI